MVRDKVICSKTTILKLRLKIFSSDPSQVFFGGKALSKLLFLPGSKFLPKLRRGRLDSWSLILFFCFSNKTLPFNWKFTLKIIYFFNNKYFQKYFDIINITYHYHIILKIFKNKSKAMVKALVEEPRDILVALPFNFQKGVSRSTAWKSQY